MREMTHTHLRHSHTREKVQQSNCTAVPRQTETRSYDSQSKTELDRRRGGEEERRIGGEEEEVRDGGLDETL